jgi:perosamine synthetase
MIPVAKPQMSKKDAKAVADTILSGWILQGPNVAEFEKILGTYIGTPYAVATSSCTTAMHLGLLACGIGHGDEVIVPSLSFIASANCIVHAGATPVFADIDERTYNIDPIDARRKITKKTKAILVVHQIGLAADMDAFMKLAKKHNLLIFEDAACGLGATINNRHVGTFGTWGAFSFHPRKAITTGEGGLLVTKSKKIADTVSMLRAHGADISVSTRHASKKILFEEYPLVGYNYRMSDIHAALGISQFARIKQIFSKRQRLADRYNKAFERVKSVIIPFVPTGYHHTYQSYMIRVEGGASIRNRIMQRLLDRGIATRAGVMASHLTKSYRAMYPNVHLPITEKVAKETIILPLYPQMTHKEQDYVINELKKTLASFLH